MRVASSSIADYLAKLPTQAHAGVARVCDIVRRAVPGLDESITYGIPTFKRDGRPVIYVAGWADHVSIYPLSARLVEALGTDLRGGSYNGKGTLKFPLGVALPATLIARLARLRAAEAAEAGPRRRAAKKR
jgi:uncharacterized protein YdhG (YjbR/CyaY superfamily)